LSVSSVLGFGAPHTSPLIGQRLKDLVLSLDPNYALDAQAEEQVLQLADDFLDKVTKQSIRLAQHRGSKTMDVQDVQLALSKQWGIEVPGLGAPTLRPSKAGSRVAASSAIKRRSSESKGGSRAKKAKPNTTAAADSNTAPMSTS
jgi:transcription initiation factor TFIID subunit 12